MYDFLITGHVPFAHPGYFPEKFNTPSGLAGRYYVLHLVLLYVRLSRPDQSEKKKKNLVHCPNGDMGLTKNILY